LLAIDAMRSLPENVTLLIAGGRHFDDGTTYASTVEEAIQKYGLSDRIRITGYLPADEVARVMSATDLALAPFSETSGSGSLALALACARPILASDIPPHREIVDDAPNAIRLFRSEDAAALAEEIERMRTEPDELLRLSVSAS